MTYVRKPRKRGTEAVRRSTRADRAALAYARPAPFNAASDNERGFAPLGPSSGRMRRVLPAAE